MDNLILWIVIVVVVIVAVVALTAIQRRRRAQLRGKFGPEYERAVARRGKLRGPEQLAARQRRREKLEIRPLPAERRDFYLSSWEKTQARFVDQPNEALREADGLVVDVMRERGYPMDDFEQRADDVSVDHPVVVENYRKANAIATKNRQGAASTEDLRQAVVHYRTLFEQLLKK